ncbi:hypothetical protein K3553_11580 [Leisingera aquaemixtae]|uniref:hypothetical protein n=1 Tax=Leisingera aquaemixtae TaxID=1396826 RepID=UPI0021A4BAA2|nr:hypothetical protein [Leisingera aquaemixtae]UWQ23627.1 hypothetical protein K3553_11580 [Leisingera aquaemixtae]
MNWKDCLRIACLSAAIAMGLLVHGAQHTAAPQTDSWSGQIKGLTPVPVETVALAHPPDQSARS